MQAPGRSGNHLAAMSWVQQRESELLLPCGTDPSETGPCLFQPSILTLNGRPFYRGAEFEKSCHGSQSTYPQDREIAGTPCSPLGSIPPFCHRNHDLPHQATPALRSCSILPQGSPSHSASSLPSPTALSSSLTRGPSVLRLWPLRS